MKRGISNKGLDTSKNKIEIKQYCPPELTKIYSTEGALARQFRIAELTSPDKTHLHIRAYVDFYGGYAEHGREVLFRLGETNKFAIKLTPIKSLIDIDPIDKQRCDSYIHNAAFDMKKSIYLCIAGPGWMQIKYLPKDRYAIGWTMVESLSCHRDFERYLGYLDELWLPTHVDQKRFENVSEQINAKVKIMRLGYDPEKFHPNVKPINIYNVRNKYVFGVLGSWNKRKGIKKIIRAFCKAFKYTDPVSLLLMCRYGTRPYDGIKDGEKVKKKDATKWDIAYEFKRYVQEFEYEKLPHITLIDLPLHGNVLPHIMARFDCLVGFSMGESTWLPGLQAMAMNIPVIQLQAHTNGFTDYMSNENCYLCKGVSYVKVDDELVKGTSEYYEDQKFAEGNEDELVQVMRKVYFDKYNSEQKAKVERARDTVLNWTWDRSIMNVMDRLESIRYGSH